MVKTDLETDTRFRRKLLSKFRNHTICNHGPLPFSFARTSYSSSQPWLCTWPEKKRETAEGPVQLAEISLKMTKNTVLTEIL